MSAPATPGAAAAATVIMVVEDDKNINEVVTEYLIDAGYSVAPFADGAPARERLFADAGISLFIFDILLPGASGLELLRDVRESGAHMAKPVIILTALGDEATQLASFDALADDFVAKPFSPRVLVKRVNALLRRGAASGKPGGAGNADNTGAVSGGVANAENSGGASGAASNVLRYEGVEIDFDRYEVNDHGAPVSLTVRETELLAALMRNPGIVLSRQRLLDLAWGRDYFGDERIVDAHIKNLRKKLSGGVIQTVKGVGYKLAPD